MTESSTPDGRRRRVIKGAPDPEAGKGRSVRLGPRVYYRDEMVASLRGVNPHTAAVARMMRPETLVRAALSRRMTLTLCGDFGPVSPEQLYAAHDRAYVDAVITGRCCNALYLPPQTFWSAARWQIGGFMAAAEAAATHPGSIVCAPVTDFAQAGQWSARDGCTFNGFLIAAQHLKAKGLVRTVGLLDMDWRVGRGTNDILRRVDLPWFHHYSLRRHFREIRRGGRRRLRRLDEWLQEVLDVLRCCDLVFYQAGAFPNPEDNFGWDKWILKRDMQVFSLAPRTSVVWNPSSAWSDTRSLSTMFTPGRGGHLLASLLTMGVFTGAV